MKTIRKATFAPLYDWARITLVVVDDFKREIESSGGKCRLGQKAETRSDEKSYYITLDRNKIHHGVVSHEANHVAWDILKQSGVKVTQSNDESLAYLSDWIVDWVHALLAKKRVRVRLKSEVDDKS